MPMEANEIAAIIKSGIPDASVEITDLRGDGDHYAALITSPSFAGKSRVAQHQMVNAALKDVLGGKLHALQIVTRLPE